MPGSYAQVIAQVLELVLGSYAQVPVAVRKCRMPSGLRRYEGVKDFLRQREYISTIIRNRKKSRNRGFFQPPSHGKIRMVINAIHQQKRSREL